MLVISQLAAFPFDQADVQPSEGNVRTAQRQKFYCSNRYLSDALHLLFHPNVSTKSPVFKCCDCSKSKKAGWAIDSPQERVLEIDDNYNKLLSDPDRGSDLEEAIWQLFLLLLFQWFLVTKTIGSNGFPMVSNGSKPLVRRWNGNDPSFRSNRTPHFYNRHHHNYFL